jgi:hypothetical protein
MFQQIIMKVFRHTIKEEEDISSTQGLKMQAGLTNLNRKAF